MSLIVVILTGCMSSKNIVWDSSENSGITDNKDEAIKIQRILAKPHHIPDLQQIRITYPYDKAVFPPDIAAPVITWDDNVKGPGRWLITIKFGSGRNPIYALVNKTRWEPSKSVWEIIKGNSVPAPAEISVEGLDRHAGNRIVSRDTVSIRTSKDPVNASIFYRKVPLPFTLEFTRLKWCIGDISSYGKPHVVMDKITVCASCHFFSDDGKYFSMEMNYGNDSGAQFVVPVRKNIELTKKDFFTWTNYPRSGIIPKTRGLFGRMSPSGKYAAASVNEISLALLTSDPRYSQVFFPTYGILAYYSMTEREIRPLPGANDYNYVQANPNWSPDEKYIVFARARTKNEVHDNIRDVSPKHKDANIYELNKKYNIQFDLFRVPFNYGKGGRPEPLAGASNNGMSNYFARYSPDGKWIVFTQSSTGIMLQPDSRLFIIPADGGKPREMHCNREEFNSWHSWSPNSRWLLFTSKVNTPFTEIFLTHVDEFGNDSVPVVLSRFSDPEYAANVPEFANIKSDAIRKITVR